VKKQELTRLPEGGFLGDSWGEGVDKISKE